MNLSHKPTDYESNSLMMVQLVYFNDRTKNTEKFYEVFTFARNSFLKYNLTRKNALLCVSFTTESQENVQCDYANISIEFIIGNVGEIFYSRHYA